MLIKSSDSFATFSYLYFPLVGDKASVLTHTYIPTQTPE